MTGRSASALEARASTRRAQQPGIVIAYDGSPGADRAIAAAALLFPAADAVVVSVDEPVLTTVAGSELAAAGVWMDVPEAGADAAAAAARTADAGATRATAAGLHATAQPVVGGPAWSEISRIANEVRAAAIVVGSRGHGALVGAFLGSVSESLTRHAGRPVLVVPPPPSEPAADPSTVE